MEKKYKLIFPNNIEFHLEQEIIEKIPKIKNILEEKDIFILEINNFDGIIFSHILTYLKYKVINPSDDSLIKNIIKNMDINTLIEFILTSNYLEIEELKELSSNYLLDIINNQSNKKIREIFKIENDLNEEDFKNIDNFYIWN